MAFPTNPSDGQIYNGYVYNNTIDVWKKDVASKDELFPIGMLYTQYPGENDPIDLGLPGTWENISSEYAGDFFRAEGGNAKEFNDGEQGDAIRNITGHIGNSIYSRDGLKSSGAFNHSNQSDKDHDISGSDVNKGSFQFDASNVVPTASENRPVNRTIRIWKRTA